jgi:hypothetical protein
MYHLWDISWGLSYLESTTDLNRVHVIHNHDPKVLRLDEFVKDPALPNVMTPDRRLTELSLCDFMGEVRPHQNVAGNTEETRNDVGNQLDPTALCNVKALERTIMYLYVVCT